MRTYFLVAITIAILTAPGHAYAADKLTYQDHMQRAMEAFQSEDWSALNTHLDAAQIAVPYSLYVLENRILARQLDGRTQEALALTKTISSRGLAITYINNHAAFIVLKADPAFASITAQLKDNITPRGDAAPIKTHPNAALLPEAYAEDANGNSYIGAVRTGQILKITKEGESRGVAFAPGGVFDIELRGDKLWAAVNNQLAYEGADADNKFASIMVIDLNTGASERTIRVSEADALLGDLEVAANGAAYSSDSITPRLFKLSPNGQNLEFFVSDERFANLQGIALDEANNRIFVADYLAGLFVIDTETGAVTAIDNTIDAHLGGIDGLYLYDGELIGIQNGTTPQRIVRLGLSEDGTKAVRFSVLAQNITGWNEPTHGAIVGDEFHYIATSNWPAYDGDGNLRDGAELAPLIVMSVPLNK